LSYLSVCVQLVVDASNVPSKYILTILSECATFPRRLIFFVKGSFGVRSHQVLEASSSSVSAESFCCCFWFLLTCTKGTCTSMLYKSLA